MFSGNINSGLLGADHSKPLHHHHQMQKQPQMVLFGSSSSSSHHHGNVNVNYPPFSSAKNKNQDQEQGCPSDEDEPDTISTDPNKSMMMKKNSSNSNNVSPWQRMKWTDTMVRLLIMAVYYIGDEGGGGVSSSTSSELGTNNNNNNNDVKKGVKTAGTGLVIQKKGKWKSVSRAMMEKGFCVSPQQCEDKFNDLNKRYKRVNDILGKGTACKVVENQNLLESMDHLSQKMKEEVRKLLNSKHLFFREMCAYHNSCGHGSNRVGIIGSDDASQSQKQEEQEQKCFHSSDEGVLKLGCEELDDHDCGDDDDDESDEDYSDDDDEEDELGEGGLKGNQNEDDHDHDHDHEDNENKSKRPRKLLASSSSSSSQLLMQQLSNEVNGVLEDGGKSIWEKKQWLKRRIVELEEKQVNYQSQAFEIEKKRLKWERFSSKKVREMEKAKLDNDKRKLENQRMVLIIQQKEIELINLHQQQHQQHSST